MTTMQDDGWEAKRAWILKNQCYKCIYENRVHNALEPYCNYAQIKKKTRTVVANERGEKIRDWDTCPLFERKGRKRKERVRETEDFTKPFEAEDIPSAAKDENVSRYKLYEPEEVAKCLSCERSECTNCVLWNKTKKRKRLTAEREVATSMFASGNTVDDVAHALGISKLSAGKYLSHYKRRLESAKRGKEEDK